MSEVLVGVIVVGALTALGMAVSRLLRGPSQADRVVALDVVFSSSIALAAGAAVGSGAPLYLDVGIGLSIIGFVSTVLWARLLDEATRGEERAPREPPSHGDTP
ncbi:MAG: cation:proton antiporter [Myxococcales bacterium]|jgi:multicomponent Na+:H+ antiporter subunit F|nr:cation:proton antiporter [Myxococcales bacterium]